MADKTEKMLTLEEALKYHKKDYKDLYSIEVGGKYIILKTPNRQTYSECIGLVTPIAGQKPDYITAGLRIMQACVVAGHKEEFFKDDSYLIPAAMKSLELLEIKEATLKKN